MPKPVARIISPAQMVACLPLQLGFVPTESLVIACCHEPRGRLGLTMRADLSSVAEERELVRQLAARVRAQWASRVLIAIYTEEPDGRRRARQSLADALREELADVVVTELVLVRGARFWSFLCEDPRCCPAEGTPVDAARKDRTVQLVHSEQVLDGRVVLASREALAQSLEGPVLLAAQAAVQRCDRAAVELSRRRARQGGPTSAQALLAAWDAAAEAAGCGRLPTDEEAATLVVSLLDGDLRDAVAAVPEEQSLPMLVLLADLCRRTPDEYAAPVCAVFAWASYCRGGGAQVTIALERALRCDPDSSIVHLLLTALDHQVEPAVLREASRGARLRSPRGGRRTVRRAG